MFKFFTVKKWFLWSWLGTITILSSLWIQVKIDVAINEWFGQFYDMIQKALASPNAITINEYWESLISFLTLAGTYVAVAVLVSFFTAHFLFRWRTAMVEWYHSVYDQARQIEGAAQRVQEDTIKFTKIMESLGTSLVEAIMVLIQFVPILLGLSIGIPIFLFGEWQFGLVTGALLWTLGGTIFLIGLGWVLKLVGVEYDLQKKEAAYRKILVIAEDDINVRPKTIEELFNDVRGIHFLSYLRYLYFNIGRIAYLQANVLSAYVFLGPAIVAGVVTLGVMQQIIRAFGRVEGSMQYLLKAWPTIIELASVYKRLKEFENQIYIESYTKKYEKSFTEN
jgi:peptide/bleomycin uptake transporter